jgi:Fe2+ transport system protein FeoA
MAPQMPLTLAGPGEEVTVVGIKAGRGLAQRLADMGLNQGVTLKVISGQMPGPVLIDLRGSRLALGSGVAHKIMVARADV